MDRVRTTVVGHVEVRGGTRPIKRLVLTEPTPDDVEEFDRPEVESDGNSNL